ncbi:hypothetical protein BH23CHL7_BH23CHL7_06680 [soil metagenome]
MPHVALWPLYPLLEHHSDVSGFGPLLVAVAIPGLLLALGQARRRPLAMLIAVAVATLPAWWLFTRHEPRFLLVLAAMVIASLHGSCEPVQHGRVQPLRWSWLQACSPSSSL